MGDIADMVIPQAAHSARRFSNSRQRSAYIRKAHEKLRRELLREYRFIVGKLSKKDVQPLPVRLPKMPTQQELGNYW